MLSRSRFRRRLHAIRDLFVVVFRLLGETFKQLDASSRSIADSFPTSVRDNLRIKRCRLYRNEMGDGPDENCRGYTAGKRRCFFGLRIFLLAAETAEPVEVFLVPGATADASALARL